MPENGVTGGTHLNAHWIKQNLDKGRFVLALRARNVQKPPVVALIKRTLSPRQDDEPA